MKKIKRLFARWMEARRRRIRCTVEHCENRKHCPQVFSLCFEHIQEDMDRFYREREEAKFERDVNVAKEAFRRLQDEGVLS